MKFNQALYKQEISDMIQEAVCQYLKENKEKIFTISIWTDVDARASSINFDTKEESYKRDRKSYDSNLEYYNMFIQYGDEEMAELHKVPDVFTPERDCSIADYKFADFIEISNESFPKYWEEHSEGKCWDEITPLLKETVIENLDELQKLPLENDIEISVNGKEDWYQETIK